MPTYRVTYRYLTAFRRLLEDIDADGLDAEQDGTWSVLWRVQLVIGQPRRVVRLRVSSREAMVDQRSCSTECEPCRSRRLGSRARPPSTTDGGSQSAEVDGAVTGDTV